MLTLLALLALSAPEADAARVVAQPVTAATAIHIDGDLSEIVWQQAPVTTGFKQRDPKDGADATFETEVRVRYRVDGELIEITPPPKPMFVPLI